MEIREQDSQWMLNALRHAQAHEQPWVVFSEAAGFSPQAVHFFSTANDAESFCVASNQTVYLGGDRFGPDDYRVMPSANLLRLFEGNTATLPLDMDAIARQMQAAGVTLVPGHDAQLAETLIRSGDYFPLQWTKTILPIDEIERYHIIHHTHPGHQVYEAGHEIAQGPSFDHYNEAASWLQNELKDKKPDSRIDDYLIVGQYRDKPLLLDMEGWPESYSGITVARAAAQYQFDLHRNTFELVEVNPLDKPAVFRQFLYGRFDADGQLKLYGDQLNETRPEQIMLSAYPSQFTYEQFNIKKSNVMEINEKSYDYVSKQLFFMGFGDEISKPLRDKMEQGLTEFTLPHTREFGKDTVNTTLHFSAGDKENMLFFNRYEMTLKQPGKEDLTQTYFVGQQYNYTLQERYNMLDGRYVYREQPRVAPQEVNGEMKMRPTGETYVAWKGLNFKETDSYGNFVPKSMNWNHQQELAKYDIKQLNEDYDKRTLMRSLEKGNKVKVTIIQEGKEVPGFVAANPRTGKPDFYDDKGQKMEVAPKERVKLGKGENLDQAESKNIKLDQKQAVTAEQNEDNKQGKKKGLKVA